MKRREFLRNVFAGTAATAAFGNGAASLAGNSDAVNSTNITTEIEAVLRRTEAIWDSQDVAGLRELWDMDDPDPYYLAGEQDHWFVGWAEVNAYLAPEGAPKITEAIRVRFYDISVRLLAPDLAYAAYWMRTDMKLVFQSKPFGSDNRVSSVFRKKPEGWRYLCYAEGFQSPTIYMQKLFERDVSPDYQEFYERVTG